MRRSGLKLGPETESRSLPSRYRKDAAHACAAHPGYFFFFPIDSTIEISWASDCLRALLMISLFVKP